ncbi:MAG TPA: c-type cytochrome [Thermoanaerobaculia bacterium]|nr:c-type cytochrome [Thermoanaerobaculia bacterium]
MRPVLSVIALLLIAGCAGQPRAHISPMVSFAPHSYETPELSTGVPARGRQAFIELQCHACHRVAGDPSLPKVEGAPEGRLLRGLCDESAESVAWKIVSRTDMSAESLYDDSPMHESASLMTERQLVDLVAYLRNPTEGCRGEQ